MLGMYLRTRTFYMIGDICVQRDRVQRADLMYMQAAAGSQASSRRKEGDESDQAKANPI